MASSALITDEPGTTVADYGNGLLAVIERAASGAPVENMERLLAMYERVQQLAAKRAFTEAKIAMRPHLPEITMKGQIIIRDKNNQNKIIQDTPFARFEDLHEVVMPVLTAHGFDLKFKNGLAPDGKVRTTTILEHVLGHEDETFFDLPHDSSGSKNAVQAVGSSTTYGKRYGMISILNLKVVGGDDDGVSALPETVVEKPIQTTRDQPFPQGPAKNKTDLKAQGRDLWRDIEACGDADMIDILLADNKVLMDQLSEALPSWWNGGVKDGEPYEGLRGVIERKQAEFGSSFDGWRTNPMRAG